MQWSGGWLLARVMEREEALAGGKNEWDDGVPIGFGEDDPDYDPAFDATAEPPPGWDRLPYEGGDVDA